MSNILRTKSTYWQTVCSIQGICTSSIQIYIFLAPDNESQGYLNPIAMTVQKLVKLHRRERLVEKGEKRGVGGVYEVWIVEP